MKVPDILSVLLISNSKILKEKYVQLISDSNTRYEYERVKLENHFDSNNNNNKNDARSLDLQFSCYSSIHSPNQTNYIQLKLIDTNDKTVINSLFDLTIKEKKTFELDDDVAIYAIKSIIYVFDEANTDTFTYVESIHKEITSKYGDFIKANKMNFLLCNLPNMIAIKIKSINLNDQEIKEKTDKLVENFLFENKDHFVYTTHVASVKASVEMNLIRNSFNKLVTKLKFNLYQINNDDVGSRVKSISSFKNIVSPTNSFNNLRDRSKSRDDRSKSGIYDGEVKNNLRNGMIN